MNITLKNGTTAEINRVRIEAQLTDSNGTAIGGLTTFTIMADEIASLPLQDLYNAVYATEESTEELSEQETAEVGNGSAN